MGPAAAPVQSPGTENLASGIRKRMLQVAGQTAVQALVLFGAAGTLRWVQAWLFLGVIVVGIAINAALLFRLSPETIAARAETAGAKSWDKVVAGLAALAHFVGVLLVAGLDMRFGWTGALPLWVWLAGAVACVLGFALFSWAMISNAYFATLVRIQEERGHMVCTNGPYRFVRHPGYAGFILQSLGVPLFLGSLWALVPGGLAALLVVVRTALEDRTLREELAGYREYAQQVRHRLLPGLW